MTGILAAIKLQQQGVKDIRILEKKQRPGGTWRENRYPGVACDVPAHMYTYSFEPNPNWSHFFAHGSEIQQYFESVVDKYQLEQFIEYEQAVTAAQYQQGKWQVTTSAAKQYQADFIICATGILHHPAYPQIAGLDQFKGQVFHTARWPGDVQIGPGTRVGVIGTGSTAAQIIPELVDSGAEVNVFQRTAQWVLPVANMAIPQWLKKQLRRFPLLVKASRNLSIFTLEHLFTKAVTGHWFQKKLLSFMCKANLRLSIKDKTLRQQLTPDYQVGCKRVIVNTGFYRTIQRDNAHLITQGIDKITTDGVLTKDGQHHKLDVLVLATGFKAMNFMRPMDLTGRDGVHIDQAWQDGIDVYRSLMLPQFPNFFLMLGPYTPIGNFSVIAMSEVQIQYVLQLIAKWQQQQFDAIEAKPEAAEEFKNYVRQGLQNTSWVGGCQSWYLDQQGLPILWPYTWKRWVKEMAQPELAHMLQHRY